MRQILGTRAQRNRADDVAPQRPPRFWIDYVTGYASTHTNEIIRAETNWDRRGLAWYGPRTDAFLPGDKIVLVDRSEATSWVSLQRVVDTQTTHEHTPDGRHFVAHTQERRTSRRRAGRTLTAALKAAGVRAVNGSRFRLSEKVWNQVRKLFAK